MLNLCFPSISKGQNPTGKKYDIFQAYDALL